MCESCLLGRTIRAMREDQGRTVKELREQTERFAGESLQRQLEDAGWPGKNRPRQAALESCRLFYGPAVFSVRELQGREQGLSP